MTSNLAHNWWVFALRGVAAIIFGVLAFVWPNITATVLVLLFGAYAFWDGVFAIVSALRRHTRTDQWWWTLLEGVIGVGIGLATFFWPGVTAVVLLAFIAAWAVITGLLEIMAAIRLRKEINDEWLLLLSGVLSVLFGILLVFQPGAGALALIWVIGSYAIAFGVLLLVLAFRLRGLGHQPTMTAHRPV
jgi:uncharacterized membrane protein HdeD (DUF308 family)